MSSPAPAVALTPADDQRLHRFFRAGATLPEIALACGLSVQAFLDWLESSPIQTVLGRIEAALHTQARLIAASAAPGSLETLSHIAASPEPASPLLQRAAAERRRAATTLLRAAAPPKPSKAPKPGAAPASAANLRSAPPPQPVAPPPFTPPPSADYLSISATSLSPLPLDPAPPPLRATTHPRRGPTPATLQAQAGTPTRQAG